MSHLEDAVLRAVYARYMLCVIESIRATDRAGHEHGAGAIRSLEEEAFLSSTERNLLEDHPLSLDDAARLRAIGDRGVSASHPRPVDLKWVGKAVQLLDAVSAFAAVTSSVTAPEKEPIQQSMPQLYRHPCRRPEDRSGSS